ncbi:unnamed protein product [Ascophyllum nodosum]
MAGKAAKKAEKASASTAHFYSRIILLIFVAALIKALYNFRNISLWQVVGLLVSSIVYYICYQGLVDAARMGAPGGAYFDVLVVCLSAQVVGLFSSYGWYIYLLIPGYYSSVAAYWVFRQFSRWVSSQQPESGSEETSAREQKRLAKKERKAARGPKFKVR